MATKTTKKTTTRTTAKRNAAKTLPRQPDALAGELLYAAVGVTHEGLRTLRTAPAHLPERVQKLRSTAPATIKQLPDKLRAELRGRLGTLEQTVAAKAEVGRQLAERIRKEQLQRVVEEARRTRSRVRSALRSIRRTGETVVDAVEETAETIAS